MKKLILIPKLLLVLMLIIINFKIFALNNTISGKITNNNKNTLPGASIVVKGANTGTTSDGLANFSINAANGSKL